MTEVIGMMEGAFFVSRGELLQWINKTFDLNLNKIEQLGTGSVYCQILDAIHPGKVNMSKVNWRAKLEWEFTNNLKILQQSFLKCGLNKYIEIEKLSKAKYQDNLEFAQWMKRYYDLNNAQTREYDAAGRRGNVEPDFSFTDKIPSSSSKNAERSFSKGKNPDLRSLSPSMKYESKKSNLLGKKLTGKFPEYDEELKRIKKNLKDIKLFIHDDKLTDKDKLGIMAEIIDATLQMKVFNKEASHGKFYKYFNYQEDD